MDTMFTFMITGVGGERISDGVDGPSTPSSAVFPYLAAPNANPRTVAAPAPPATSHAH
jgi:hypothetical protein